ncbi:MAG: hypothetical protein IJ460_03385 [Clostridia bacterium]|nr:hypothetical protein [Clostridia bacterium]
MKRKILALLLALCMVMSCMYVTVSAEETETASSSVVLISTIDGVTKTDSKNLWIIGGDSTSTVEAENNGLGGKASEDTYTKLFSPNAGQTYFNLKNLKGSNHLDKNYVVLSVNVYGNVSNVVAKTRYSGTLQPQISDTIKAASLKANQWNNLTIVYNTETYIAYYTVNGVKGADYDLGAYLETNGVDIATVDPEFRFIFDRNKTVYYDDVFGYKTDAEPATTYASVTADETVYSGSMIPVSSESMAITAPYAVTKSSDDGVTWVTAETVSIGDIVAVENQYVQDTTVYGKTYKYFKCIDPAYSKQIATSADMTFTQGGSPKDADGNTISDTRETVENVHGSGMAMEFMGAGINNASSRQTFYNYDWQDAKNPTTKYLVAECDFAFASSSGSIVPATGFSMSTNGGTPIANAVTSGRNQLNRVSHFVWVYDIENGTYTTYLNGKVHGTENAPMAEKFITGEGTNIRFIMNGVTDLENEDKTKLYSGYLANITLTECNTAPAIKEPIYIPGTKLSTFPITTNTITLGEILAMFDEADRENVTVYFNRSYNAVTDENASVSAGSGIIVTEKDGIYDYARICLAPGEDADYAIETLQYNSDGSINIYLLNYASKRTVTPFAVRYANDGSIIDIVYDGSKTMNNNATFGLKVPAYDGESTVQYFVWEDMTSLRPLGQAIKIK